MTTIDRHSEAAALAFGHATANTAAALRAFAAQLDDRKLVAGLEGRMFVRAGLDPAYATEEALKIVLDMGMLQGITETWDRLAEHLEARQG